MPLFSYPRLLGCGGAAVDAHAPSGQDADPHAEVLVLFDQLSSRLLRYAVSFGLPTQDAEDVLQEAFLALDRHLMKGRSRDNLPGWLYRTTHNLALKRRAALHTETRPLQWHNGDASDAIVMDELSLNPEDSLLFQERQHRLRAVMRALPETDQMCLRLRADGLRYRDIAATVGISLGSVAASLARSIKRMQAMDLR